MGRRCSSCGTAQFPPMGVCPKCGSSEASWFPLSGKGKLMFASVGPHRMFGITFLQATVKLAEGPWISGVLLDDTFDFSKPQRILDYTGADIDVNLEITKNPEGVEAIAFRIVR